MTGERPFESGDASRIVDNEEGRLKARVIWYYYVGGMTQQEIADKLNLTRLRVNRIVGQARTDGSVELKVHLPHFDCIEIAEQLCQRYGLVDAIVMPSPGLEDTQRIVGETAAMMLDGLLADGQLVGIGWGRTLGEGLRRLPPRQHPHSWVVSLMGGLARGSGTNTFEVATQLARLIGSQCYYLPAPIFAPNEDSRDAMLTHFGLREVLAKARAVDVAVVSCGDLDSGRSNLSQAESVRQQTESLREAGAVGDIIGTFIDAAGNPVDHPLNRRVIAMPPADLKPVKTSILASGGTHKAPILRACLTARFCNRLVTDEDTARLLLQPA